MFLSIIANNLFAARMEIPTELKKITAEFTELEEAFREGEWDEAEELAEELTNQYARVLPKLYKAAKGRPESKKIKQFSFLVKNLKKNIGAKNRQKAGKSFELMEVLIIDFIELFDYDKHPYLEAVDNEFEEMIEDPEFDEIVEEVEELKTVIKRLEPRIKNWGVSSAKLNSFFQQLDQLKSAAETENRKMTIALLTTLKELNEEFIAAN